MGLTVLLLVQAAIIGVWERVDRARGRPGLVVSVERRSDPGRDVEIEERDGAKRTVAARSGRFKLLHFWATWCPPCRTELPALIEMARRNRARLDVWAISADPDWPAVSRFVGGMVPAMVVRDPGGTASRAYGVSSLPDTYLIDPGGRIVARFPKAQDWAAKEMDRILEGLIAGR